MVSRRGVLNAMGTVGGASLLFSSSGLGKADVDPEDWERENLTGQEKKDTILGAFSDQDFRDLYINRVREGWQPNFGDAICRRISGPEGSYDYSLIPCRSVGDEQSGERVICWIGNDSLGVDFPYTAFAQKAKSKLTPETAGADFAWEVQSTVPSENGINQMDTNTVSPSFKGVEPERVADACYVNVLVCPPDKALWKCFLDLIVAAVGVIGSCAFCVVDPTKLSCFLCATAIVGLGLAWYGCENSAQCHWERRLVSKEKLREHNLNCEGEYVER